MSSMDVSLRLRLLNELSRPAKDARKDIKALADEAKTAGGRKASDLAQAFERASRAANTAQRDVRSMSGALKASWSPAVAGAQNYSVALGRVKVNAEAVERASRRATTAARQAARAGANALPGRDAFGRFARGGGASPAPSARERVGAASGGAAPHKAAAAGALAARMSGMGGSALYGLVGGAAAAMGVAATIRKSLALERVMYEVQKATDASGDALKRIETFLNDTARASGKTAEELGQMYAAAGFAGRPVKDLERFTKYAAMATNAWNIPAEQAGQALAEIGNIYQASQTRIEEIGDALNTAADVSAARESDLLEFLRRVGGAAKGLNISAEETLAFGAAMKEVGVGTEVAATGFQAFLVKLSQADDIDDDLAKKLKAIGVNAKTLGRNFSVKPVETMVDLLKRIDGMKDGVKRTKLLVDMFGAEYADDLARMANASGRLDELLAKMRNRKSYLGSVQRSFELMSEKDFNKLERAQQAIAQMARTIGGPLKVAAGEVATEFNRIADRVAKGANALDRYRAERDAFDEASGKHLTKTAPGEQGKTLLGRVGDWAFGEEGKRDEQLRAARRAGWRKAAEARRAEEETALRRRADIQRRYDVRRSRGYYEGKDGAPPDALQRELAHHDEVARRIHQARAATEKRFGETRAAVASAQARNSQIGRWGLDPLATPKPWAQQPDKAPAIGTVSPGLSMMPEAKALTGPKSAGWMKAAAGEASKLSIAVQDAATQAQTLQTALGADLAGPANTAMASYNAALQAGVDRALAIAKAGAAALSSALSFSAQPNLSPRLSPPAAAPARGGKGAGKSARLSGGGSISIAQAHFHGVKDVAGMQRQLLASADRKARGSHGAALHDVETG